MFKVTPSEGGVLNQEGLYVWLLRNTLHCVWKRLASCLSAAYDRPCV